MRSSLEFSGTNDHSHGGVALAVSAALGLLGSLWLLAAAVEALAPIGRWHPATAAVPACSASRCDATAAPNV